MDIRKRDMPDRLHYLEPDTDITNATDLEMGHLYFYIETTNALPIPHLFFIDESLASIEIGLRTKDWEGHGVLSPPRFNVDGNVLTATYTEKLMSQSVVTYRWFLPNGVVRFGTSVDLSTEGITALDAVVFLQATDQFGNWSNLSPVTLLSISSTGSSELANSPASIEYVYENTRPATSLVWVNKPMNEVGTLPLLYTLTPDTSEVTLTLVRDFGSRALYEYLLIPDGGTGNYPTAAKIDIAYNTVADGDVDYQFTMHQVNSNIITAEPKILRLSRSGATYKELLVYFYPLNTAGQPIVGQLTCNHPTHASLVRTAQAEYYSIWEYEVLKDSNDDYYTNLSISGSWFDPTTTTTETITYELEDGPGGSEGSYTAAGSTDGTTSGGSFGPGTSSGSGGSSGGGSGGGSGGSGSGPFTPNRTTTTTAPGAIATHRVITFDVNLAADANGEGMAYTISHSAELYPKVIGTTAAGGHVFELHAIDSDSPGAVSAFITLTYSDNSTYNINMQVVNSSNPSYSRGDDVLSVAAVGETFSIPTSAASVPNDGQAYRIRVIGLDPKYLTVVGAEIVTPGVSIQLEVDDNPEYAGVSTKFKLVAEDSNGNQSNAADLTLPIAHPTYNFAGLSVTIPTRVKGALVSMALTGTQSGVEYQMVPVFNCVAEEADDWESSYLDIRIGNYDQLVKFKIIARKDGIIYQGAKDVSTVIHNTASGVNEASLVITNYARKWFSNDRVDRHRTTMGYVLPWNNGPGDSLEIAADWNWIKMTGDQYYFNWLGQGLGQWISSTDPHQLTHMPCIINLTEGQKHSKTGGFTVAWEDWEFNDNLNTVTVDILNTDGSLYYRTPDQSNNQFKQVTIAANDMPNASHVKVTLSYNWTNPIGNALTLSPKPIEVQVANPQYGWESTIDAGFEVIVQGAYNTGVMGHFKEESTMMGVNLRDPGFGIELGHAGVYNKHTMFPQEALKYDLTSTELECLSDTNNSCRFFYDGPYAGNHTGKFRILGFTRSGLTTAEVSTNQFNVDIDMGEAFNLQFHSPTTTRYMMTVFIEYAGRNTTVNVPINRVAISNQTYSYPIHDITNATYTIPRGTGTWEVRCRGGAQGGVDSVVSGLRPTPVVSEASDGDYLGELKVITFTVLDVFSFHRVRGVASGGGWCTLRRIN